MTSERPYFPLPPFIPMLLGLQLLRGTSKSLSHFNPVSGCRWSCGNLCPPALGGSRKNEPCQRKSLASPPSSRTGSQIAAFSEGSENTNQPVSPAQPCWNTNSASEKPLALCGEELIKARASRGWGEGRSRIIHWSKGTCTGGGMEEASGRERK